MLDRYTIKSVMTITIVYLFLYMINFFPEQSIILYFLGLVSYIMGISFMFKEMDFDNLILPIALMRFFQMIIPLSGLIKVGLSFFFK